MNTYEIPEVEMNYDEWIMELKIEVTGNSTQTCSFMNH